MNNQLATTGNSIEKISFTQEQVQLIKTQIAPKASDAELQLFLYQARKTGLDPLARQIYCLPIGGKMSIQTSIDGFRVVAERSGDYAGQDEPEFVETDGKLTCAKVRVYRFKGDQRYLAAVGVAYMAEYKQGTPMWGKMPYTMLSKCAEALALRKAFPQDLSGLYTNDEINDGEQKTEDVTPSSVSTKKNPATAAIMKKAIDRIAAGEEGVRGNMQSAFQLTEEQDNDLMLAEQSKADENSVA